MAPPPAVSRASPLAELVITLLYVVFGGLWVVGSDTVVARMMGEPPESVSFQTIKGLNFIATTGALLYLVLRRSFNRRRRAEEASRLDHERLEMAARRDGRDLGHGRHGRHAVVERRN